jgi:hypothetical protein
VEERIGVVRHRRHLVVVDSGSCRSSRSKAAAGFGRRWCRRCDGTQGRRPFVVVVGAVAVYQFDVIVIIIIIIIVRVLDNPTLLLGALLLLLQLIIIIFFHGAAADVVFSSIGSIGLTG